jgi:hypothetical protein
MARNAKDVYRDALALSDEERDELVRLLTQRDDEGWASPEIKQAWMEEIARRVRLREAGKARTIPAEQVLRRARQLLDE